MTETGTRVRNNDGHEGEIVTTPPGYYEPATRVRPTWIVHVAWDNGAVTPEDKATLVKVVGRG